MFKMKYKIVFNSILAILLIYFSLISNQISCDSNYSPSFHDLTNIPINDHDVISSTNDTNSSSNSSNNKTNSINSSNQFFDLTSHSTIDNSTSLSNQTNLLSVQSNHHQTSHSKCELITLPICKGIGYNHTKMPNQLNHDTQDEAGLDAHMFYPLVEINCSDDFRLLLCLIYAPVCIEDFDEFIPPCRSTCERAKTGCEPLMANHKFPWPKQMNCDKFPVHSSESICIDKKIQSNHLPGEKTNIDMDNSIFNLGNIPIIEDNQQYDSKDKKPHFTGFDLFSEHKNKDHNEQIDSEEPNEMNNKKKKSNKRIKTNQKNNYKSSLDDFDDQSTKHHSSTNNHPDLENGIFLSPDCKCECKRPFLSINHLNDKRFFNRIVTGNQIINCVQSCNQHPYFTRTEQAVAIFWITLFSFVCAFCTLITLLTFISDTKRFQYPERCIIFLSACYLMVSIGFLIRIYVGHENVACDILTNDILINDHQSDQQFNRRIAQSDSYQNDNHHSIKEQQSNNLLTLIRYENTGQIPGNCLIIFWLLYYFGMSAAVWWVLLTFTWFLQASLKWSNEAIDSYSQYFHLIAWFLPAIKSIIIISIGSIDGDVLTGVCYVGNLNDKNLLIFVIIPLCAYLIVGILFLLSGFYSLFRIRSVLRQQTRSKTDKLEKLMVRIVIFSVLYIVPGSIVILCNLYEYKNRQNWALNHNCQCKSTYHGHSKENKFDGVTKISHPFANENPLYIVFLIKYIMSLIVGITSGFWIWSSKTLDSWLKFYGRLFCCYCFGACKPEKKLNKQETLRQSHNSMSTHLMSNVRQESYNNQQSFNNQPFSNQHQGSQMMTNSSQYTNNSNRAYAKLLNQQQQMQQHQQQKQMQFGAHLAGRSLSSSNNGSSSTSHCKLPLSHV